MKRSLLEWDDEVESKVISHEDTIAPFLKKVIIPKLSKEKQAGIKALTDTGVGIIKACEQNGVKIGYR